MSKNRLFSYVKEYKMFYILALCFMTIMVVLDLATPVISGKIIDLLGEKQINFNTILILIAVLILCLIALETLRYIQTILLHTTGHKIVLKIREQVFTHIQNLSHAQFNDVPVGKLVTRVTSDVNVLFDLYTNILVNLLKNIVTVVSVFVTMFIINAKLTLILLLVLPVIVAFAFIFQYYSRKVHRKVRDNVSNMNAFLSENISGVKITQVFSEEEKKYNEFKENNNNLKKSYIKEIFVFGIFRPSIFVLYFISVILVLYFGGNEAIDVNNGVLETGMTFGVLFSFYMLISRFFNPIQAFADQFNELQSAFAASEKIYSILDTTSQIQDSEDAIDLEITGDIEFRDVWFAYVGEEWVLKGVSFHIKKDEVIAFVGATGSGKTTILSLIIRNYDIQKGQILIDGVDIKKIKLSSLRSQIGQMLQDVFLFSGTIKTNISMHEEDIKDEEIIKACEYVNASKFIEKLPDGYDFETKERGNNFSSGQRQLISFGRTIVHKPKVLILDEATSNIDTETESLIQDSLSKIMKTQTVIVVAHRLSTIQHATRIYVFSNGNIIESGNHQELLALRGRYYKLYKLQFDPNYSN